MAKEDKKGFLLYYDYREHFKLLNDEERGKLLMALLEYGEHGKQPEDLKGAALMAFSFIRAQMDRDSEKYNQTVEKRKEAGRKGGRPAKEETNVKAKKANGFSEKQVKAKKPDTVTDTDTDTVTNTVTDTDTDTVTNTVTDTDTEYTNCAPDGAPSVSTENVDELVIPDSLPGTAKKADVSALFEALWKLYPSKKGKGRVSEATKRKLYDIGLDEMSRAIERYKAGLAAETWRKLQNGSTFFNSGYIDYLDANYVPDINVGRTATDAPDNDLPDTTNPFLRMLWEEEHKERETLNAQQEVDT